MLIRFSTYLRFPLAACAAVVVVMLGAWGAAVQTRAQEAGPARGGALPAGTRFLESSPQRPGDPLRGYEYLIHGDYVSSGVPLEIYRQAAGPAVADLGRSGAASGVSYRFNVVQSAEGVPVVAPNCLTCHAERLQGRLVVGLGNNSDDHTARTSVPVMAAAMATTLKYGADSPEAKSYAPILRSHQAIGPLITTHVRGVNPADKIFAALAAHRNAADLSWLPVSQFDVPVATVPTDVPAWWLLKKKNALYYNGLGRGDFARLSSASGMLTMKDSVEADRMDVRFPDVMAWIRTLEAPAYPHAISPEQTTRGRILFEKKCASCHGTYGARETYPNLLVSLDTIGTDPLLSQSYTQNPEYHTWYNESWYGQGPHAGRLEPNDGYVAPPLDGVWATAPYLHNGSVPTLEDLLNSPQRPTFWKRNFQNDDYDEAMGGWRYETMTEGGDSRIYDTTRPGYGNGGHEFGDLFTADERKAVIAYLQSL